VTSTPRSLRRIGQADSLVERASLTARERAGMAWVDERWVPGRRIGPYQVLRMLGQGSFGTTVLARRGGPASSGFSKLVALKIMRGEHAGNAEVALRMLDEAKVQAALQHDQLVDVYDLRRIDEDLVIEMEYVEGVTLHQFLAAAGWRLSNQSMAYIIASLLRGAVFMHGARDEQQQSLGVVHRDLKPSNVLLSRTGVVKVGDFGCVRGRGRLLDTGLLKDAMPLGTPRYMAPEQCLGEPVDGRADVYAIGVMFYEMLSAGKHPTWQHADMNDYDAMIAATSCDPVSIQEHAPGVSPGLAQLVDSMIARAPSARPTAKQAVEQLLRVLPFEPLKAEASLSKKVLKLLRAIPEPQTTTAADEPTECVGNSAEEATAPDASTVLNPLRVARAEKTMVIRDDQHLPQGRSNRLLWACFGALAFAAGAMAAWHLFGT
jgi:serine/threonine protein kinase